MERSSGASETELLRGSGDRNYGSLPSNRSSGSETTIVTKDQSPGTSISKRLSGSEPEPYGPLDAPWRVYIQEEIEESTLLQLQLILLTFCTGCLDTITLSTYHVFTSKQTGNTIFMAIALLDISSAINQKEYSILVSFLSFIFGSTAFGWGGNYMGHKKRGWLLLNSAISFSLLLSATVIRYLCPTARTTACTHPNLAYLVISLCAMACSAQFSLAANSRGLEINTSVVTGAIICQATDRRTFARHNPPRDRRVAFYLGILIGALVGATLVKFSGATAAMAFVACCKLSIGLSFLLNPGTITAVGGA